MKHLRRFFLFLVTLFLVAIGIVAYNKLTDGFSIHQITSSLPPCPQFDVVLTPDKKRELQLILNQEFRYLGKGCQFYVFESSDGSYVLKFPKQKHLRSFCWLNSIPMPSKLRHQCDTIIARRADRVNTLFASCKLAYEKMPEETGLVFIHLNKRSAVEQNVVLVDKLGCKHTIEIDKYEFCLQRKGVLLKDIFTQCSEQDAYQRVEQLIGLITARCQKGICDRDKALVQNIAFLDQRAIFTDFGQFDEDPKIATLEGQVHDIKQRLDALRQWTQMHFPDLAKIMF